LIPIIRREAVRNIVKVTIVNNVSNIVIDFDDLIVVGFTFVTEFKKCVTQELG